MKYRVSLKNTPSVLHSTLSLTLKTWKLLFENGVFVNPIVSPATPPGRQLLRTSYMATHTDDQLDHVLTIFEKVGKQLELI